MIQLPTSRMSGFFNRPLPQASLMMSLLLGVSTGHAGNLNQKLDLELKFQEKISRILHPVDPHAQILVNVRFRPLQMALPGTGGMMMGQIFMQPASNPKPGEELERVEITVFSGLDPFPETVRKALDQALDLPVSVKGLSIERTDSALLNRLSDIEQSRERHASELISLLRGSFRELTWGVTGLGLLLISLVAFSIRSRTKAYRNSIRQIAEVLKVPDGRESGHSSAAKGISDGYDLRGSTMSTRENQASISTDEERARIQSMEIRSLLALLSDCYWCAEDQYGAWLWKRMTHQQRTALLEEWKPAESYAAYLSGKPEKNLLAHEHPSCLRPLPIWNVSQEDLLLWVKSNPGAWSWISPLRRERFTALCLQERLEFDRAQPFQILPQLPSPSSSLRKLRAQVSLGILSEQDELEILKNPGLVPDEHRLQLTSLVWLALLAKDEREEVLAGLTASSIAEAWIGPAEVLALVEQAIPGRKRELVQDYQGSVVARRSSDAMAYLTHEAVRRLVRTSSEKGSGQKSPGEGEAA